MNDTYLSRFWGSDYQVILNVADIGRSLPPFWVDIASVDQSRRLEAFKVLVRQVFIHMPETSSLLMERTTDAYLVKVRDDVALGCGDDLTI